MDARVCYNYVHFSLSLTFVLSHPNKYICFRVRMKNTGNEAFLCLLSSFWWRPLTAKWYLPSEDRELRCHWLCGGGE